MCANYEETSLLEIYDTIYELRVLYDSVVNPFVMLTKQKQTPVTSVSHNLTEQDFDNKVAKENEKAPVVLNEKLNVSNTSLVDNWSPNFLISHHQKKITYKDNKEKLFFQAFDSNESQIMGSEPKPVDEELLHKVLSLPKIVENLVSSRPVDILRTMKESGIIGEEDFRELAKRIREGKNLSVFENTGIENLILTAFLLNSGIRISFLVNVLQDGGGSHE
jgi:hypothetical protein